MAAPMEPRITPIAPVDRADGTPIGVATDGSGNRRLMVDSTLTAGEIQIGAVELDDGEGSTRAMIRPDTATIPATPNDAALSIAGRDDAGPTVRHIRVDSSGRLIVVGPGGAAAISTVLANVEETVEVGGVDIFPSDAAVPRDGIVRLQFITDTAAVLSAKIIRNAVTRVGDIKEGATIQPDRWQEFFLSVKSGDAVNLRVSVGGTVTAMITFEDTD